MRHNRQSLQFFEDESSGSQELEGFVTWKKSGQEFAGNRGECSILQFLCLQLLFVCLYLLSNACMFYIQGAAETLEQLWISYNQVKPHSSTIHPLSI